MILTRRHGLLASTGCAISALLRITPSRSQSSRPLRLLVGAGAGSVPDIVARTVGERLATSSGRAVVVENRPGPGGIAAIQALLASDPDGSTFALATINQLVFNSYLFSKLPYDPGKLEPVSLVASNSFSIAVSSAAPFKTFESLVAHAKAQPGKLSVGTSPPGTAPHVFATILARLTNIHIAFVPYRSGLEGLTGLIRGDVQLLLDSPAIMVPQVKAGAIRVVAVTGRAREAELPDVPTMVEVGFPVLECESWFGISAGPGISHDVVNTLNRQVTAVLADDDMRRRLAALSLQTRPTTSAEFRQLVQREHGRWGRVLSEIGIKLD
jgi:tripartite-type tricarboxylate transporter receptor subunit TctC